MFALRGIQNKDPNLTYCPEHFNAWCCGETNNEFVNAFMRQLLHTGWMSNRGRQIVASYLINEMSIDWRYGAAWFEQQLIDYDVAANWGNWQYLAGVGTDPRGRRHFNIEKQRQTYDPECTFITRWLAQ
jgi:deoxyribodipyrimidine photo-lyase